MHCLEGCLWSHTWMVSFISSPSRNVLKRLFFLLKTENQPINSQFHNIPHYCTWFHTIDSILTSQFCDSVCDSAIGEITGPYFLSVHAHSYVTHRGSYSICGGCAELSVFLSESCIPGKFLGAKPTFLGWNSCWNLVLQSPECNSLKPWPFTLLLPSSTMSSVLIVSVQVLHRRSQFCVANPRHYYTSVASAVTSDPLRLLRSSDWSSELFAASPLTLFYILLLLRIASWHLLASWISEWRQRCIWKLIHCRS